jgi:hypothetical protein
MKEWKPAYKITAINTAIVILIGLVCGFATGSNGFGVTLGIVCLAGAVIDIFLGIIFSATHSSPNNNWGKGFLNSAGILLLLSGISCGTGFSNMSFR